MKYTKTIQIIAANFSPKIVDENATHLSKGVYVWMCGAQFETPAELNDYVLKVHRLVKRLKVFCHPRECGDPEFRTR